MKRSEINPNTIKCSKTWVYGPMGWTGCVRCEKFWHDFVARTFFTNCTVQPKLLCVLYNKKVISNAPEHNKTHQNMSLGSNGVDRVLSLRKIERQLRGTNFCTSSTHFAPSFIRQPNGPKCTQIVWNAAKREFRVQWDGSSAFIVKNSDATLFCFEIGKAMKWSQINQNVTKHTETWV